MTGPEHYREAEGLLDALQELRHDDLARTEVVARAQVHATLALAAATAEGEHCANGWTSALAKRAVATS